MNENQVAYVNNRFIRKSGTPISDVLKITNSLDIEVLLMAVDIEKTSYYINHSFLVCVLKNLDLVMTFLKMVTYLDKKTRIVCYQ